MSEYRIVRDQYCGYEVQYRTRLWPFWRQAGLSTHTSVERAEEFARKHAQECVKYLGRLPPTVGGREP